jgi:hypothetical protein
MRRPDRIHPVLMPSSYAAEQLRRLGDNRFDHSGRHERPFWPNGTYFSQRKIDLRV